MFAPKSILVPTDFSEYSDKALMAAEDIARQFNAKIYLLHVVEALPQLCADQYCLDPLIIKQVEEESLRSARQKMQDELSRIKAAGVETEIEVREGTAYREILKEQQEKQIDLIVIASHGRTGLINYLIGSVAEKVARSARCPVLLIKN